MVQMWLSSPPHPCRNSARPHSGERRERGRRGTAKEERPAEGAGLDAYQDGGRVQARQLVLRPQHRHPSCRPNRHSSGARFAFKPPCGPSLVRPDAHVTFSGRGFVEGGAPLKEPLPLFLEACYCSGARRLRCCLWDRPFISRLGRRRYSVIHSFIFVHSCSFTELLSPAAPAPPTSSSSQLTPSLQLLRTKPGGYSWLLFFTTNSQSLNKPVGSNLKMQPETDHFSLPPLPPPG